MGKSQKPILVKVIFNKIFFEKTKLLLLRIILKYPSFHIQIKEL